MLTYWTMQRNINVNTMLVVSLSNLSLNINVLNLSIPWMLFCDSDAVHSLLEVIIHFMSHFVPLHPWFC